MDHPAWSWQAAAPATSSTVAVLPPIKQQQPTGSNEDCHSRHSMTTVSSHLGPEQELSIEACIGHSSNPLIRPSTEHDHDIDTDRELDGFLVLQDDLLRSASGAARVPNITVEVQQQQPAALKDDRHSSQLVTPADSTQADLSQQPVLPKSATATEGVLLQEGQQHRQQQQHLNGSEPASTADTAAMRAVSALQQAQGQYDPFDTANHQQRQQQQLITVVLEPLGPPLPCSSMALARQIAQQQQHQPVRLLGPFTITTEPASPCSAKNTRQELQHMIARAQQQQQQQQLLLLQRQQFGCPRLPSSCPFWQYQQQQALSIAPDSTDVLLPDIAAVLNSSTTSSARTVPDTITADVYLRAHTALQQRLQEAYQAGHRDGKQHALQQEAAHQQQQQRQHKHQQHGSKRPLQTSAVHRSTKKARSVPAKSAPVLSELLASDRESAEARLRNMSDSELLLLAAQMLMQKCPSALA